MSLICVLIGLPGVGKSTFARLLEKMYKERVEDGNFVHLEYDLIFNELSNGTNDLEVWKESRKEAFEKLEAMLQDHKHPNSLYIIDDNMYYRSMRRPFFKLAQKCGIGYVQIYLHSDISRVLKNNVERSKASFVPESIIERMNVRFEIPEPEKRHWESHTIFVNNDRSIDELIREIDDNIWPRIQNL